MSTSSDIVVGVFTLAGSALTGGITFISLLIKQKSDFDLKKLSVRTERLRLASEKKYEHYVEFIAFVGNWLNMTPNEVKDQSRPLRKRLAHIQLLAETEELRIACASFLTETDKLFELTKKHTEASQNLDAQKTEENKKALDASGKAWNITFQNLKKQSDQVITLLSNDFRQEL